MTKEELFKKYSIDESHSEWNNQINNWMSVEVYRVMHDGNLPPPDDLSSDWITQFLDDIHARDDFFMEMKKRKDWGRLYLTAKRMVYRHSETILEQVGLNAD